MIQKEATMRVVRQSLCGLIVLALIAVTGAGQGTVQTSSFFLARQGAFSTPITPLTQPGSAVDFYRFANDQPNTGLEVANQAIVFLYRDANTRDLSLIIILSKPGNVGGGEATLRFDGLPTTAQIVLRDDPADTYEFSPPRPR
jgi:hypothetical protein